MLEGVKEDGVTVLGKLKLPYIDYENPHHFSAIHSDPPGIMTDYPAFLEAKIGKGKVIWWSIPFEGYTDHQSRELVMQILRTTCPTRSAYCLPAEHLWQSLSFSLTRRNGLSVP